MAPELSVIIPILNDSKALENLALSLNTQKEIQFEVIVSDGGDPDSAESRASELLCKRNGFRYLTSESGRGKQMNVGRAYARCEYFLFLHADSQCSSEFQFRQALDTFKIQEKDDKKIAGHFGLLFQSKDMQFEFMLGFLERKSKLNRKNSTNGDQGLLISKKFFDEIGGFSEQLSFLEDQIIVENIRKEGRIFTLPNPLLTSARRFEEEGFVRRYYLMMIIMGAYRTQTRELFELAPPLYVNQDEAGKLDMRPFFETISDVHETIGFRRSVKMWREVGAFVRENIWQGFLFADYLTGERENLFLDFYDTKLHGRKSQTVDNILGGVAYLTVTKTAPAIYKTLRVLRK